jgi:pimeloyl-ACP methyl ester carboxylesterase
VPLASVNGVSLAYQEFGSGSPLVPLHGGFGSWEMFGPNLELLAKEHRVIGVDLQSHGRTPAADRVMTFEAMAGDVAALIAKLGLGSAAVMGFSLGGGVALRTAIQHPEVVDRLVLVSTPFKRMGWHPEMTNGMDAMGPHIAEPFKQTPMYQDYERIAPNKEDWPVLVEQLTTLLKKDYDWSADVARLTMPVMLVVGDADGLPPSHAAAFFELLGGGKRDAGWDMSGMTRHRLAVLPGVTHYDMNVRPELARAVLPFLAGG